METDLVKIKQKLDKILSPERGYFGRVDTWGQKPEKYEYIGYELSQDFLPTLEKMTEMQRKNLLRVMMYFEMHAHPLKKMLTTKDTFYLDEFLSTRAWSHFMTMVMFGMLEVATKIQTWAVFDKKKRSLSPKGDQIKKFFEENLSIETKQTISKKYSPDKLFEYNKDINSFSDVIDHLWFEIRSGFIHDASIQAVELEPYKISGIGSKEDPFKFKPQVSVHEWLKAAWEAILNSYGYKGALIFPKVKKN